MIRTFKRKLILTKEQSKRIDSWIGVCRMVYNLGLEIKISAYKSTGKSPTAFDLMKQLTIMKKDYSWVSDVLCDSMNEALLRLERTYRNFYKGAGFPKWASKKKYRSIYLPNVRAKNNTVKLPKIGWVKIVKDSAVEGVPISAVLVKEITGYFICIRCESVPQKFVSENQAIGLDMGINQLSTASDGSIIENPRHFKAYEQRLRVANRSLARKKKGSNSWERQARKLALLYYKIRNVRTDFLHKESTKIAKRFEVVYLEDLKIRNMAKNARLSKHVIDCGWFTFRLMLAYKTRVVAINPKYTSQTCHSCGTVDAKSRVSQSCFVCSSCGNESHADHNAALNILSKGIALDRERKAIA